MKYKSLIILAIILLAANGVIVFGQQPVNRDVIIGFNKPVEQAEINFIKDNGGEIKTNFHLIPAIAARVPEVAIDALKKNPKVKYIENENVYRASDEYTGSWGVQHIGAEEVHNQSISGNGVKIAVLDTGINYTHEDLSRNYRGGYDFVFDDTNTLDDSYNSHGTHVSGIIAAEKNGIGIVGIAPNASIYAVKVLDGSGFGNTSWVISGIQWAVDNNMSIVSMSLGGSVHDQSLHDASDAAYNAGLLLIASAGNTNGGSVTYPAGFDSVIAVTAVDSNDKNASFAPVDPKIELAAPGVNINSTIRGGYGVLSGTSMAAPYVAGVAALVYEANLSDVNGDGKADNKDVRLILNNSAKDLGIEGKDSIYGYGLVDAQKSVLGIATNPNSSSSPNSSSDSNSSSNPNSSSGEFSINLTLNRSKGPSSADSQNVTLQQGNYTISITNVNLTAIDMLIYINGTLQRKQSKTFKLTKSQKIDANLKVTDVAKIVFVPYGKEFTLGYVTIKKI